MSLLPWPLSNPHATTATPLELATLVGPAGWARLPAAVRRRFAAGHADTAYNGRLSLRCSRIGRLYAGLSRPLSSPLTTLCGTDLPSQVRVLDDRQGGVIWERWFGAEGEHVRSTKSHGPKGLLQERTEGGLGMDLDVFEQQGELVFRSRRYFLAWRSLRLPIPTWLGPGVCTVSHADLGQGNFRFTLVMQHPLWGETFHQCGVFVDPVTE